MENKIIKYLQEEKRAINVRSEEEWIELMRYFEFYDIRWKVNCKATGFVAFELYEEETAIRLAFSSKEELMYQSNEFYKREGYTIILFQDFKKEFIKKDLAYQLHLAKKRVEELEKQIKEENTKYYAIFKLTKKDSNYLKFDNAFKDYFINGKDESKQFKTEFTKKELEELKVWDNPLFEIVEVED